MVDIASTSEQVNSYVNSYGIKKRYNSASLKGEQLESQKALFSKLYGYGKNKEEKRKQRSEKYDKEVFK